MEGTATMEDIDLAMKLGSKLSVRPFESREARIELLEAVYEDTRDGRHKICPLLKKEYLATL